MSEKAKRRTASIVAEIDPCEIGIRFLTAYLGMKPPPECKTAQDAVKCLDQMDQVHLMAASESVLRYIVEQINASKQPS